jgi:hypothetical protein
MVTDGRLPVLAVAATNPVSVSRHVSVFQMCAVLTPEGAGSMSVPFGSGQIFGGFCRKTPKLKNIENTKHRS